MPPITAVLHTRNDARRLGRALEMLVPCDEILIIDHESGDGTQRLGRDFGAQIVAADRDRPASHYLARARSDWILCLRPAESISEGFQASLYEFKLRAPESVNPSAAFSICVREETPEGWISLPRPETRLVSRHWQRWNGDLPESEGSAQRLEGELLRFAFP